MGAAAATVAVEEVASMAAGDPMAAGLTAADPTVAGLIVADLTAADVPMAEEVTVAAAPTVARRAACPEECLDERPGE
jgi:hypothetical protein